ncbi:hypothetical protein ABZ942_40410 [Nocardia sp. NPDC046473]|uniref:hypothetical protein n=1 Tax=Nocardia sp. NPDC046473 TaxID=3155733 RepID=UPI0033E5ECA1
MKFSRVAALAGAMIAAAAVVGSGAANAVHPPTTITPFLCPSGSVSLPGNG